MRKTLMVLALAAVLPIPVRAQGRTARPQVAVILTAQGVVPADSARIAGAIARGLQADSAVDVVARPPVPGQAVREASYVVAAMVQPVGATFRVGIRAFGTKNSNIVASGEVSGATAIVGDSLNAIGRRIARTIAAEKR